MQEYEKRLLAKDHEIKVAQASARELQKRLDQANTELADSSRMAAPEPAPAQGAAMHEGKVIAQLSRAFHHEYSFLGSVPLPTH